MGHGTQSWSDKRQPQLDGLPTALLLVGGADLSPLLIVEQRQVDGARPMAFRELPRAADIHKLACSFPEACEIRRRLGAHA